MWNQKNEHVVVVICCYFFVLPARYGDDGGGGKKKHTVNMCIQKIYILRRQYNMPTCLQIHTILLQSDGLSFYF